jgi:type II secretory pathway component GspD/PulD (secretin)
VSPVPARGAAGSIIVCDYACNVMELAKVIEQLDSGTSVRSRVVKLKHRKLDDVYDVIHSAAGKQVRVGFDNATQAVVLSGSAEDVDRVAEVIAALDVEQK